jgi:anti-sigma regulatory factor (Ser/Thr protein kinase)
MPTLLVDALLPDGPDDDVALLIASVGSPVGDERPARVVLAQNDTAVAAARDFAAALVRQWGSRDVAFDVQLLVSELVTNALRHGEAPIELRLRRAADDLLIEVHDAGRALPRPRDAGPAEDTGRGLRLVAAISDRWGTRPDVDGKSVWCTVRLDGSRP